LSRQIVQHESITRCHHSKATRSNSNRNCSKNWLFGKTDIVAIKRNTVLRIQVKSTTAGWVHSIACNNVLAVVSNDSPVRYFCKRRFPSMSLFESIEVLKKRVRVTR
jgi:hypothetical protein